MNTKRSRNADAVRPRRGTVACKRCRRLRSKCSHEGHPPCDTCRQAGGSSAIECTFPSRGDKGNDRDFRAKRHNLCASSTMTKNQISNMPHGDAATAKNHTNLLPPHGEVIEGFQIFITSYFQLGFIPKAVFLERLSKDVTSMGVFLLLTILGISARFTPSLIRRYGSREQATLHFIKLAMSLVPGEMYEPSLERIQAFFLLSISEWGNGDKNCSFIHMGIAVRMAAIMRLHREETYRLSASATADEVVESEMARRTFWMIQSQDNLHSGHSTPVSFSPSDITALLPSEESDFAFGTVPLSRAALQNTPSAIANPSLVSSSDRSLFATLIQAHNLWGNVARRACRNDDKSFGQTKAPWDVTSEYTQLSDDLQIWENKMPARHRWSVWNLRGYKAESRDLAYLSVVMVLRLSNIVLRRIYLEDLIRATGDGFGSGNDPHQEFWEKMSHELFANVHELHEQIDAYFLLRSKDEGFPAILVFCVYVCGSLASYLWKWPQLCPQMATYAEEMANKSLSVLDNLQYAWPTAMRWSAGLKQAATPLSDVGVSLIFPSDQSGDQRGNIPAINSGRETTTSSSSEATRVTQTEDGFPEDATLGMTQRQQCNHETSWSLSYSPPSNRAMETFEADFNAFLQGDLDYAYPNSF